MGDGTNRVDLLTLEEFRSRLDSRLTDAKALVQKLNHMSRPALGTFQDANATISDYDRVHRQHVQRANRLVSAIEAAQSATDSIIRNYKTTESRNAASQAEIRRALGDVTLTLEGPTNEQ
jgi:ABC-type transporter Mla subunit MlaD